MSRTESEGSAFRRASEAAVIGPDCANRLQAPLGELVALGSLFPEEAELFLSRLLNRTLRAHLSKFGSPLKVPTHG